MEQNHNYIIYNLLIKTEPVSAGADATITHMLLLHVQCIHIAGTETTSNKASAPNVIGSAFMRRLSLRDFKPIFS